jgi:hypothetical protein
MRIGTHARGTHAKGEINNQFLITGFSIRPIIADIFENFPFYDGFPELRFSPLLKQGGKKINWHAVQPTVGKHD